MTFTAKVVDENGFADSVGQGMIWYIQNDDNADKTVYATVVNGKGAVFAMRDGSTWKVISIRCTSIGGVGVNQNITPHAYSQSDSILIRLSKNL